MTEATKKKHVARELNDYYHIPDDDEEIVQVIRGCGNNLHEVRTIHNEQYLVSMPTKFRRSVWIKRGDYLIVTPIAEGNKVRAEIHTILLKDHIRYLKQQNKWPSEFDDSKFEENECDDQDDDDDDDQEDQLPINMNRMNIIEQNISDTDSDSEHETTSTSDEEEDEQQKI